MDNTALILETLTKHYYFQAMLPDEVKEITSFAHLLYFDEGMNVFLEGEESKSFFYRGGRADSGL